jgi:hypothetical protein
MVQVRSKGKDWMQVVDKTPSETHEAPWSSMMSLACRKRRVDERG